MDIRPNCQWQSERSFFLMESETIECPGGGMVDALDLKSSDQ
jgi:hypothetical protein